MFSAFAVFPVAVAVTMLVRTVSGIAISLVMHSLLPRLPIALAMLAGFTFPLTPLGQQDLVDGRSLFKLCRLRGLVHIVGRYIGCHRTEEGRKGSRP
jgi:hypothetical protein